MGCLGIDLRQQRAEQGHRDAADHRARRQRPLRQRIVHLGQVVATELLQHAVELRRRECKVGSLAGGGGGERQGQGVAAGYGVDATSALERDSRPGEQVERGWRGQRVDDRALKQSAPLRR